MLSFGDPGLFSDKIRSAGVPLVCQVQTLEHARRALDVGADLLVAQGAEAGGHGGGRGTIAFTPAVADLVSERSPDTLVLAAGGIADGRGLAAALMLGADGVLVGTRFYATAEAAVDSRLKQRAVGAFGDDTVRTRVFDVARGLQWPEEFTARAVRNDFTDEWHGKEAELHAARTIEEERYRHAAAGANPAVAAVFAGEAVDLIHSIDSAATVMTDMSAMAERLLRNVDAPDA